MKETASEAFRGQQDEKTDGVLVTAGADDPSTGDVAMLLDENEQLKTELETSLDENARLIEDRDRLLRRVTTLARELQTTTAKQLDRTDGQVSAPVEVPPTETKLSETEEELRVAFEELQVLTEELEVANNELQRANEQLEERVRARTRELTALNADLRRSELRMSTLIEGIPQLVWRSADHGRWTWSSPQWTDFTGQTPAMAMEMGWVDALHPDDRDLATAAWGKADGGADLSFEARIRNGAQGRYRHFQTRAMPVRTPEGTVLEWLGTCTDVHDITRLREQQNVLVDELQHRTRNLMAVVHAVMIRTIKGSRTLDDFRRCIDDRMSALTRVQSLLSRRGSQRIAFDTLLRAELSAHVDLDSDNGGSKILLSGPTDVPLQTSLVQTFALALHELATNAVKYGALSTPEGKLLVTWHTALSSGGKQRLHVDWQETGVTNVPEPGAAPRGGGYGRELIERALPYQLGAKTSYRFTSDGVRCTIEVDVPDDDGRVETDDAGALA